MSDPLSEVPHLFGEMSKTLALCLGALRIPADIMRDPQGARLACPEYGVEIIFALEAGGAGGAGWLVRIANNLAAAGAEPETVAMLALDDYADAAKAAALAVAHRILDATLAD